jgi:small subunit ribosomal protein S2
MLTNWGTIQYRIERLNFLETQEQTKEFEQLSKKKKQKLTRELTHLRKYFDGVKDLKERPNVIIICNARHEINVIQEAQILNIPVIALVDITVDPSLISFPIPATPHLKHTVDYLLQKSANCILAGKLNKKK